MTIPEGADLRLPEHRRETFLRFYAFHLNHRAHPGLVYSLMPELASREGWDMEQRLWFAFLNGNTQNPVTSMRLMQAAPHPRHAVKAIRLYERDWDRLQWDTDRRHHKGMFPLVVEHYLHLMERAGGQEAYWAEASEGGWPRAWQAATAIHSFGRLSAFSYLEYLRIMGVPVTCEDLMLGDMDGSRSHRNGLCIVLGRDDLDWKDREHPVRYTPETIDWLVYEGERLLHEAQAVIGHPDTHYFTLESALCTYKSWHRPNRRYANVYQDMLYDRLRWSERKWGAGPLTDLFWAIRKETQPGVLLLEATPTDPGLSRVKQNHYRETGRTPMLGHDDPELWSAFDQAVKDGTMGVFR